MISSDLGSVCRSQPAAVSTEGVFVLQTCWAVCSLCCSAGFSVFTLLYLQWCIFEFMWSYFVITNIHHSVHRLFMDCLGITKCNHWYPPSKEIIQWYRRLNSEKGKNHFPHPKSSNGPVSRLWLSSLFPIFPAYPVDSWVTV